MSTSKKSAVSELTKAQPMFPGSPPGLFNDTLPPSDMPKTGVDQAYGAGKTELIAQTYNAALGRYEFTGNQDIDAALIGSRWTVTNLTFSFPTSGTFYQNEYGPNTEPSGHVTFNTAQQTAARYALDLVASYTNMTFSEVTESETNHANVRLSQTDRSDIVDSAQGHFPSSSSQAGDIWFGLTGQPFYLTPAKGNWGQATIMHEIGHTLGLKHGHQTYTGVDLAGYGDLDHPTGGGPRYGSAALPSNHDGQAWSLMTYRSNPGAPVDFQGEGINQPQTYMQNDIAALQTLYGANFNTQSGDTVYTWNPTTGEQSIDGVGQGAPTGNKILMTLWDGNGVDTYDLSNYSTNLNIDLAPGAFSTFSSAQLANHRVYTGQTALAPGNVANALLYQGDNRSLIENAFGGSGNDTMAGNDAVNSLWGNDGADILSGRAGNDYLKGGGGADALNGGEDTDLLKGGGGADTLAGGGGIDTATYEYSAAVDVALDGLGLGGDADGDTLTGIENLIGSSNNDTLRGNDGGNRLDGSGGADTLAGGAGDDTYVVDNAGDAIQESTGVDAILASVSYMLAAAVSVELLKTTDDAGTGRLDLTGNEFANTIAGNAGANLLDGGVGVDSMHGGLGNDTYVVDNAGDTVVEATGEGTDIVYTKVSYALGANQSVETLQLDASTVAQPLNLTGNNIGNVLIGNAGANVLNGSAGADLLQGGSGNDSYVVDNAGDVVRESGGANSGVDTVVTTVSYALGAGQYVETLQISSTVGASALNLTGNELANALIGNTGSNALQGLAGADVLQGGGGRDILVPGNDTQADTIRFNAIADSTGGNRDQLLSADFNNEDKLDFAIRPTVFLGAVTTGALNNGPNFNIEIGNAVNGLLNASGAVEAVLFDPNSGGLNQEGHAYLVVDANNDGSYSANADYLVELVNFTGTLDISDFI